LDLKQVALETMGRPSGTPGMRSLNLEFMHSPTYIGLITLVEGLRISAPSSMPSGLSCGGLKLLWWAQERKLGGWAVGLRWDPTPSDLREL